MKTTTSVLVTIFRLFRLRTVCSCWQVLSISGDGYRNTRNTTYALNVVKVDPDVLA
jgi:hypothetical protein